MGQIYHGTCMHETSPLLFEYNNTTVPIQKGVKGNEWFTNET